MGCIQYGIWSCIKYANELASQILQLGPSDCILAFFQLRSELHCRQHGAISRFPTLKIRILKRSIMVPFRRVFLERGCASAE